MQWIMYEDTYKNVSPEFNLYNHIFVEFLDKLFLNFEDKNLLQIFFFFL